MAEQLHCSEIIYSKNIENMLSKLYIYRHVLYSSRCNKVHAKHRICNGGYITNYVTCVSGCFGDVKAEGASLSTPSFIIFSPFYKLNEEKEDSEG